MLGRARYAIPFGIAIFTPSVVFAKEENTSATKLKRTPWDVYCDPCPPKKEACKKPAVSELEKCIQKCREDLGPIQNEASDYLAQAKAVLKDASSTVVENVKYLQTGASDETRMATIAGGSVLGFLLGFRKSFFKKLLYGVMGGGLTAAIIYPTETKVILKEGSVYAKTTIKDAYAQIAGSGADKPAKCDNKQKKPKKEGSKNSNASTSTT